MAIKYIATFADGKIVRRTSASERIYSHCWRIQYVSRLEGVARDYVGFGGSLALAQDRVRSYRGMQYAEAGTLRTEIVEVVVETKPRAVKS